MWARGVRLSVAAGVVGLVLSGCGADAPDAPDVDEIGAEEPVRGDLEVVRAELSYPTDDVYDVGEDADLYLVVANTGDAEDDLLDVRGRYFAAALLTVDGVAGAIRIPAADVRIGPGDSPAVVLRDLRVSLRSSDSIPVTLVFEEAGEITVDAVVPAQDRADAPLDADNPDGDATG
jgi:copper(I)-binding protein